MTFRQQVYALAAKLGATVNLYYDGPKGIDIEIVAPQGQRWEATDTHCIVTSTIEVEPRPTKESAWEGLLGDMVDGIHPCDDHGEGAATLVTDDDGNPSCEFCTTTDGFIHAVRGFAQGFLP